MAQVHVKRSMPSLIGGIFTGVVAFVLWLLLLGAGNPVAVIAGVVVAVAIGSWVRLADL